MSCLSIVRVANKNGLELINVPGGSSIKDCIQKVRKEYNNRDDFFDAYVYKIKGNNTTPMAVLVRRTAWGKIIAFSEKSSLNWEAWVKKALNTFNDWESSLDNKINESFKRKYMAEGFKLGYKKALRENIEDDDLDGWYSEPLVAGDIEEGDIIITNYGEKITALVSNVEISSQYKFRGNNIITDIWARELPYGSVLHFDSSRSDLFRSKDNVTVIKPDDFDSLSDRIRNSIDKVESMIIPGKY